MACVHSDRLTVVRCEGGDGVEAAVMKLTAEDHSLGPLALSACVCVYWGEGITTIKDTERTTHKYMLREWCIHMYCT